MPAGSIRRRAASSSASAWAARVHDGLLDPTDPDKKALGSRILFHIPIEIGLRLDDRRSISVYFEHMSNAFLVDSNEGLDSIGVRYGYKF